jgi:hypothetical protein
MNFKEFNIICKCGTKYKSIISAMHKPNECYHISIKPCPGCGSNKNIKNFNKIS